MSEKSKNKILNEQIVNIKAEIERNIIGFDTQVKQNLNENIQLIGAKNYAQFLLTEIEKDKKEKNGT